MLMWLTCVQVSIGIIIGACVAAAVVTGAVLAALLRRYYVKKSLE